ncbi:MAG TPA: sugar ABC transporter ATP-binding protein [Acidimicrobiales bacterium]|nr:sugar ABC transporter ATP-binding protein [Acidimicrobiales bacterium]
MGSSGHDGGQGTARPDGQLLAPGRGEPAAVALWSISKNFGETRALIDVDLRIDRGEVVALVGQNGSGKSTVVKVLSGYHVPEPGGRLVVSGDEIPLPLAPGQAGQIGLSFVYQNLALAGGLSVLENLNLGTRLRPGLGSWTPIHWHRERRRAEAVLARYGVSLDLGQRVRELAPVDQARLAIVRAAEELRRFRDRTGYQHSVLVLDEPTVFLPEEDVAFLFQLVRTVVTEGAGVLFISHDLSAIREIADRIVVLRDGRVVAEARAGEVDEDALVELIVGAAASRGLGHDTGGRRPVAAGGVSADGAAGAAAAADAMTGAAVVGDARAGAAAAGEANVGAAPGGEVATGDGVVIDHLSGRRLRDLSVTVGAGEIVGVAGLIGSGAEDIPYLLFGAALAATGTLWLGNRAFRIPQLTPDRCVAEGIALVPADRAVLGLSAPLTVWENMVMLVERASYRRGVFHRSELVRLAEDGIGDFAIRPPRPYLPAGSLSGGNQQKVVLAKWLTATPRLLVLHEPTQGVDVGARRDIYRFVKAAAARHRMSVLWVTTDFGELAEVCDRVVICAQGRAQGELGSSELSDDAISAAVLRHSEDGPPAGETTSAPSPSRPESTNGAAPGRGEHNEGSTGR